MWCVPLSGNVAQRALVLPLGVREPLRNATQLDRQEARVRGDVDLGDGEEAEEVEKAPEVNSDLQTLSDHGGSEDAGMSV